MQSSKNPAVISFAGQTVLKRNQHTFVCRISIGRCIQPPRTFVILRSMIWLRQQMIFGSVLRNASEPGSRSARSRFGFTAGSLKPEVLAPVGAGLPL